MVPLVHHSFFRSFDRGARQALDCVSADRPAARSFVRATAHSFFSIGCLIFRALERSIAPSLGWSLDRVTVRPFDRVGVRSFVRLPYRSIGRSATRVFDRSIARPCVRPCVRLVGRSFAC